MARRLRFQIPLIKTVHAAFPLNRYRVSGSAAGRCWAAGRVEIWRGGCRCNHRLLTGPFGCRCLQQEKLLTTASDERRASRPILGGWLRLRFAPYGSIPRPARASGVNNPAIQSAPPLRQNVSGSAVGKIAV